MDTSTIKKLLEKTGTPRILLEVLAAYNYQTKQNTSFEDAVDMLSRELDLGEMTIRVHKDFPISELIKTFEKSGLQVDKPDQILSALSGYWRFDPQLKGIYYPPEWLVDSLILLSKLDQPTLFLNAGNSTLIPQFLANFRQKHEHFVEFIAVEQNKESLDNLRLMISLVEDDLEKIRLSVFLLPESLVQDSDKQLDLFDNRSAAAIPGEFGAIYINLVPQSVRKPQAPIELTQNLHNFLNRKLSPDGRIIINGPSNMLDSLMWSKLRDRLKAEFQIESIADFSFAEQIFDEAQINSAFITLRKPQQATAKQITLFSPADFSGFNPNTKNPLGDLIDVVLALEESGVDSDPSNFQQILDLKSAFVFDLPSSELANRWDAKYYCPGRQHLQDELISNPNINWLGSISDFILHGTPRSILIPYTTVTTRIDYSTAKESIAPLRAGDQVWLNLVDESSEIFEGDIHMRIERRSGSLIGYLPEEYVSKFLIETGEIGERHPASVINIKDDPNLKRLNLTIQFAPPDIDQPIEQITVVRPKDITSNRLTGTGESALIPNEMRERITFLEAGDILLYLGRGGLNACVVPSSWEGSICHQDMVIVRPKRDQVDSYYLLSFLLGSEFQNQLRYVLRSRTLRSFDKKELEEFLVILPPMADQRQFALAFAEGSGDLDVAGRRGELEEHTLTPEEFERLISNFVSEITSDIDRLHDFDDWIRIKSERVRQIKELILKFEDASQIEEIRAIVALDRVSDAIEQYRVAPRGNIPAKKLIETKLFEFEDAILDIGDNFIRSRLSELVRIFINLLKAQYIPANIEVWLDQDTIPAGPPTLLSLSITAYSPEDLYDVEIIPVLSQGVFVEEPHWQIDFLDQSEMLSVQAYARFDEPGLTYLDCAIRFTQRDGSRVEQMERLSFQIIPLADAPFTPIYPNPYITGGAVDTPQMFFGRQDVLDFLKANLIGKHQSNVITLQGNRRTGKTSILKQTIRQDIFAPHIPVYIDCQGLGTLTDQKFFYKITREILRTLRARGIDDIPTITTNNISNDDPFYDFRETLDQITSLIPGRRIILLIDEFELIDQAIQEQRLSAIVLENLRHIFQHRHDIAVVLTGSYRLRKLSQEYWSALFGLGLMHNIGFLDEEAAKRLISQPLAEQVRYTEDAVKRIIQMTACHPYFVQMVCHNIVNVVNEKHSTFVSLSIVEEAAQETLTSADGHFRYLYQSSGASVNQAIIVFLASSLTASVVEESLVLPGYEIEKFIDNNRLPIEHQELEDVLRELSDRDIVSIQGDIRQRLYGFKIDLVRQWIRRNYDLQSAIKLAQSTPYIREE